MDYYLFNNQIAENNHVEIVFTTDQYDVDGKGEFGAVFGKTFIFRLNLPWLHLEKWATFYQVTLFLVMAMVMMMYYVEKRRRSNDI